jgi:hypothetical protein
MSSITTSSTRNTNVTTPGGVSIPSPTKREARMFAILLAQARKHDIQRRLKEGKDVLTDSEVKVIAAFCEQAIKEAHV